MPEEQLWGRNTANGQEIIYDMCNRQPSPSSHIQGGQNSTATATAHGHLNHPLSLPGPGESAGVARPALKPGVKLSSPSWVAAPGEEMAHGVCPRVGGAGKGVRAEPTDQTGSSLAFPSSGH